MRILLISLLPLLLCAESSFITPMEYSSSLYKNPRGIGCDNCHGLKGEGKLVATYIHKKKKKEFRGPAINNVLFSDFKDSLNKSKKGMPRYYLTDSEIKALFFYLQEIKLIDDK